MIAEEKAGEARSQLRALVRRVGKNQVVSLSGARPVQEIEDILFSNSANEVGLSEVPLDRRDRARIPFDESRAGGTAAKRFNPERAGAGKKIEDACSDHPFAQAGEDGGLNPVHRWTDIGLGNSKADAAGTSGDDSHGDGEGIGEEVSAGTSLGEGAGG